MIGATMFAHARECLIDNPLLTRERRRWARRGWVWLPLALLAWVPMSILARDSDAGMMLGVVSVWEAAALSTLQVLLRPDILLAMFFVYLGVHSAGWHAMRPHLGATLITPGQVIAGKVLIPIGVLVVLHSAGSYFYYGHLVLDTQLYFQPWGPGGPRWHLAYAIMPLALLEDMLFGVVAVLVALEQYLLRRDALGATIHTFLRLMMVCAGIAVCQWVWELAVLLGPIELVQYLVFNPRASFVIGNGVWFALVLPFEWVVIRLTLRRITRELPRVLGREDEHTSPHSAGAAMG